MRHRRSGPKCLRPNGYVERCSLNDGCFDESEHPAGGAAPGPPPRKPPAPAGGVCGEENCVDEDGFVMDNNCPQNIPSTLVNALGVWVVRCDVKKSAALYLLARHIFHAIARVEGRETK